MPMENVREDTRDGQIRGFSEFSKPECSVKLINPSVPSSGFEGKSMFGSSDSEGFYERLSKLNESLGYNLVVDVRQTKLNLYLFYKEVTLRGGFNQVNKDRRWDDIASSLKMDGRKLNNPDILLKLYALFLFHYEQIYFYRGPEKVASVPDITIDREDSPQMEMKCTHHSSQMVTNDEEGPHGRKMLKKSCSQLMSTGLGSAEKQSAPEAEQKQIPQLHSEKDEIRTKGYVSEENQPEVPEEALEQTSQLQSKKKRMGRRGSASVENKVVVPKRKYMKKPGARLGIRSAYHIFIKTECDRLKKIQSRKGQNLRQMANDAWNQLSEAEKQPFHEQSIKEKESLANKVVVDDEQTHVMECAENKQSSPEGGYYQVLLDPNDAENSIDVD
ncbi:high mobility group B protein 9-like [Argentina anserina]|uniref:high mobility group B protein 9-like n=1 Tax=Argentina anserina TaxID=57926 RepID=UPI0021761D7B|nr:high mobility group B protein 9-like [Potentilla anserina]